MEVPAVFLYNYLYGIQETGSCSLLYSVSYCGVDQIPQKSIESRYWRLFAKENKADKQFSPWDRNIGGKY